MKSNLSVLLLLSVVALASAQFNDDNTTTGAASDPTNWLRCVVNVEVSSSSTPGVGNEAWWAQNYETMKEFIDICSTSETTNSFQVKTHAAGNLNRFALPVGAMVFELDENKIPYTFVPFYKADEINLPGGRFAGTLQCYKTWTKQTLELKACEPSAVNKLGVGPAAAATVNAAQK